MVPAELRVDDVAISRAVKLCQQFDASMTILWPQDPASDNGMGFASFPEVLAQIKARMATITQQIESSSWAKVTWRVEVGKLFLEVLRRVQIEQFDLVLKTARGKNRGRQMLLGGDALHLIRKCPCPVWIVDPETHGPAAIVAAVDPMPVDQQARNVAKHIMQLATSLASQDKVTVHVVHAWASPGELLQRDLSWLNLKKADDPGHIDAIKERHAQALNVLIEPYLQPPFDLKVHLIRGLPEKVITTLASKVDAGTLVMACLARTDVPGLLIGNTAEIVLHDVNRSVLVVKPEHYQSPISL